MLWIFVVVVVVGCCFFCRFRSSVYGDVLYLLLFLCYVDYYVFFYIYFIPSLSNNMGQFLLQTLRNSDIVG